MIVGSPQKVSGFLDFIVDCGFPCEWDTGPQLIHNFSAVTESTIRSLSTRVEKHLTDKKVDLVTNQGDSAEKQELALVKRGVAAVAKLRSASEWTGPVADFIGSLRPSRGKVLPEPHSLVVQYKDVVGLLPELKNDPLKELVCACARKYLAAGDIDELCQLFDTVEETGQDVTLISSAIL